MFRLLSFIFYLCLLVFPLVSFSFAFFFFVFSFFSSFRSSFRLFVFFCHWWLSFVICLVSYVCVLLSGVFRLSSFDFYDAQMIRQALFTAEGEIEMKRREVIHHHVRVRVKGLGLELELGLRLGLGLGSCVRVMVRVMC